MSLILNHYFLRGFIQPLKSSTAMFNPIHFCVLTMLFIGVINSYSVNAQDVQEQFAIDTDKDTRQHTDNSNALTLLNEIHDQSIQQISFSPDGTQIIYLKAQLNNSRIFDVWLHDVASAKSTLLISPQPTAKFPNATIEDIAFIDKGSAIAFLSAGDIFTYTLATKTLNTLTKTDTVEHSLVVSPSLEKITFIRDNNIFYIDIHSGKEKQLTKLTKNVTKNGVGDKNAIEFLARKSHYWWSPNEEDIAFIRTSHSRINSPKSTDLEAKSATSLILLDIKRNKLKALTTVKSGFHVLDVKWLTGSDQLSYVWLDKSQQSLGLNTYRLKSDKQTNIIYEQSPFWVNTEQDWLFSHDNKSLIWSSERDGYKHLYHYRSNGEKIAQITSGDWSVDNLIGFDSKNGWVYFTGRNDSPLERHFYKAPVSTKTPENVMKISRKAGFHDVILSPNLTNYISLFSNSTSPRRVNFHQISGQFVQSIEENIDDGSEILQPVKTIFGSLQSKDKQTTLFYKIYTPADLPAGTKHPAMVLLPQSPIMQRVRNQWRDTSLISYWVNQGFVVFELDARGSKHRGTAFQFPLFQNIGTTELSDHLVGIEFLANLAYVDKNNIALYGEQYGGYLGLRLLSDTSRINKKQFTKAVIGNPIYDWSIYRSFLSDKWLKINNAETALAGSQKASTPTQKESAAKAININDIKTKLFIFDSHTNESLKGSQFNLLSNDLKEAGKTFESFTFNELNDDNSNLKQLSNDQLYQQQLLKKVTEFYID